MKQFIVITAIITVSVLVIMVFLTTVLGLGSSAEVKSGTVDKLPITVSEVGLRSAAPAPPYHATQNCAGVRYRWRGCVRPHRHDIERKPVLA
jgi:hypothetical protein